MSENRINFVIAVRGYKNVKKQKNGKFTDITAEDNLNRVFLRVIEPLGDELVGIQEVKNLAEYMKLENYASAVLFSERFTEEAIKEMEQQNIQYISKDYMPPFDIEQLYLAIMEYVNNQCQKRCNKTLPAITNCAEKNMNLCQIKKLAASAKDHFDNGTVGLLKNDLKMALALNR
jgi:hypothetical protein